MTAFKLAIPDLAALRPRRIYGGLRLAPQTAGVLRHRIMPQPLPDTLVLPLQTGQGEAADPVIEAGDRVEKYQLLAQARLPGSQAVHAPTSGTVTAISHHPVAEQDRPRRLSILLRCDGEDRGTAAEPLPSYQALPASQLRERLVQAGVAARAGALNGAGQAVGSAQHLLLINAMESDPYSCADAALIRERAHELVQGAEILQASRECSHCIIVMDAALHEAVAPLQQALNPSSVQLMLLPARYPLDSEQQLVQAVTGQQLPAGLSAELCGIAVYSVATACAAHNAIVRGIPYISRVTTLTGSPLKTPKNFDALIGTPAAFLLQLCGMEPGGLQSLMAGGAMNGISLEQADVPVSKSVDCLIAVSDDEFVRPGPELPCVRCGDCASVCPARLQPHLLHAAAGADSLHLLLEHGLDACVECGACSFVCPSHIPLLQSFRHARQHLEDWQRQVQQGTQWRDKYRQHSQRDREARQDRAARQDRVAKKRQGDNSAEPPAPTFSREKARDEIAAAVARVKSRRQHIIASSREQGDAD